MGWNAQSTGIFTEVEVNGQRQWGLNVWDRSVQRTMLNLPGRDDLPADLLPAFAHAGPAAFRVLWQSTNMLNNSRYLTWENFDFHTEHIRTTFADCIAARKHRTLAAITGDSAGAIAETIVPDMLRHCGIPFTPVRDIGQDRRGIDGWVDQWPIDVCCSYNEGTLQKKANIADGSGVIPFVLPRPRAKRTDNLEQLSGAETGRPHPHYNYLQVFCHTVLGQVHRQDISDLTPEHLVMGLPHMPVTARYGCSPFYAPAIIELANHNLNTIAPRYPIRNERARSALFRFLAPGVQARSSAPAPSPVPFVL
jgi:hypothetical protein